MPVPESTAYYGLVVLTLLNFVNYVDRFILAALQPRVKVDLGLSDFQLGLLSNAFLVVYFASSPVFGRLGGHGRRVPLMAAGVAIWSGATVVAGWTRTFGQLLGARAMVGIGEAAYATISPTLIADYFAPSRHGRAFSVFYLAAPIGGAAGFLLASAIEPVYGWRGAFFLVGFPGLVLAALTLTVADPGRSSEGARHRGGDSSPPADTLLESLRALARSRPFVWAVAGYTAYTFSIGGLTIWLPTFLERVRGFDLARANLLVGSITVVTGLAGTLAGGFLGDYLSSRIAQAHLLVSGVSMLLACPFIFVTLTEPAHTVLLIALFAGSFFAFVSTSPINVVIVNAVAPALRTMAMAVSIFVIHLLGDGLAAPLVGLVADVTDLARAMLLLPVVMAVAGAIWTTAARLD